jgi:hypothetical protein
MHKREKGGIRNTSLLGPLYMHRLWRQNGIQLPIVTYLIGQRQRIKRARDVSRVRVVDTGIKIGMFRRHFANGLVLAVVRVQSEVFRHLEKGTAIQITTKRKENKEKTSLNRTTKVKQSTLYKAKYCVLAEKCPECS